MQARLNPYGTVLGPKFAKYLVSANKVVATRHCRRQHRNW